MGGLRSGVTASRVVIDGRPELLGLEAELRVECTLGILEEKTCRFSNKTT